MRFLRAAVFFAFVICSFNCSAAAKVTSSSQDELIHLLETRSLREFDADTAALESKVRADQACEAELKARAIPRSCFGARFGGSSREVARLVRICRTNAMASRSRLDLEADNRLVPADCQTAIEARREDLRYADEEKSPEMSAIRTPGTKIE